MQRLQIQIPRMTRLLSLLCITGVATATAQTDNPGENDSPESLTLRQPSQFLTTDPTSVSAGFPELTFTTLSAANSYAALYSARPCLAMMSSRPTGIQRESPHADSLPPIPTARPQGAAAVTKQHGQSNVIHLPGRILLNTSVQFSGWRYIQPGNDDGVGFLDSDTPAIPPPAAAPPPSPLP